jgi:nucleolar MIF4G domain-containing protein 1
VLNDILLCTYSSRTRFMIETLTNLRNNKMKPATGVAADAEANLKRFITNLAKKSSGVCRPNHAGLQT